MTSNNKRMIIVSIVLAVSVLLLLVFMLLGVNLGFFKIPSITYLLSEYDIVKKSENDLVKTQETYYNTVNGLETAQEEYNKQKNKYNSISDETINVIKEATTEESYNLEYMWIKLGNYAKKNNLEIVMVEPGGSANTSSNDDSSKDTTKGQSKATTTKSNESNNTKNNTTTKSDSTNETTTKNTNSTSNSSTTKNSQDTISSSGSAFKIQVKGSYMNTSDFIFEVENDTALRFKLDNISMDYVEGTTIKTTFDVKNITVNK